MKKLTILHSNDLHGDFLAKEIDANLVGGVSLLSGYIANVRETEENVLYCIAGDMFRGSLIDSEFKGVSTIEIMNMLTPDIATIGNHEVDYGIAHLLFLEKCAKFPIINANIYIKSNHVRLFKGHHIIEIDGMKILFIGVLTEEVLAQTRNEKYIGTLVDVEEACKEVGRICDFYKTEDIDLTVLLTHIGIESDKELANILNPKWGIDLIIGGHSHTLLDEPVIVNSIPIVQAASGTNQIGRFDLKIDVEHNCIDSYEWQLIPIDDSHCPRDYPLENIINHYKEETDQKYNRYITRLAGEFTHPKRNQETEIGKLFADIMCRSLKLDIMFVASGSIRKETFGPLVLYKDIVEIFPFSAEVYRCYVTGKQLVKMMKHLFRKEAFKEGAHIEFYQFSRGLEVFIDRKKKKVVDIKFNGKDIEDNKKYRIGFQEYHYLNMEEFFGVSLEEINNNGMPKVVATSDQTLIEEYLSSKELVKKPKGNRWVFINNEDD